MFRIIDHCYVNKVTSDFLNLYPDVSNEFYNSADSRPYRKNWYANYLFDSNGNMKNIKIVENDMYHEAYHYIYKKIGNFYVADVEIDYNDEILKQISVPRKKVFTDTYRVFSFYGKTLESLAEVYLLADSITASSF